MNECAIRRVQHNHTVTPKMTQKQMAGKIQAFGVLVMDSGVRVINEAFSQP